MYGMDDESCAIRATIASPGQRTLPMQISSTSDGEMLPVPVLLGILSKHPLNAEDKSVEGKTFARAPFRARQRGVRTALTMTTSRGFLRDDMVGTVCFNFNVQYCKLCTH